MIGQTLAHYRVTAKIGEGGMGVVYRAEDTKLGRDVALKILPQAFAQEPQRMARFEREAQVLASLNHPNIATIHGIEDGAGVRALVMELVEGPTLAERIALGPIPVEEALPIAKQIAEALEYAHERGIIHRDLKPANIKLTKDGAVKVLDFGLAKALADDPAGTDISTSPTLSMAATKAGIILGTAAYMSPEQARGKPADKRADVWSFGVVLYEMLTGRQAYTGETGSDILAKVLEREPDWTALPASVPPRIRELLRRCLTKDPKQRLQAIGEARIAIEETLSEKEEVTTGRELPLQKSSPRAILWGLAGLILGAVATGVAWSLIHTLQPPTRPIAHVAVTLPTTDRLVLGPTPIAAFSPDGSRLVYVATRGGSAQLYVRAIDGSEPAPIPGTEGAETPFFSPDGQSVGFFAEGKLKKVSLSGGAPLTLCSAPLNRGASWGPDDTIIFTPAAATSGLFQVSAAGGTPKQLTTPDHSKGEISHRWPEILPGGKALLFTIWIGSSFDNSRIGLLSLETGERRVLLEGGAYARYVPSGHLVFARAGGLLAVPFDLKRLKVSGSPVAILEGVNTSPISGAAGFSISGDGSFVYVPGGSSFGERTLVWVDRNGAVQALPAPPRAYASPRLSPDGLRLAVGIQGSNPGLWLYELGRGTLTRLAATALVPFPSWMPDGRQVTFAAALNGPYNLYRIPADGSGAAERLTTSENMQFPGSWSPDGQVLLYSEADSKTGWHMWMLKLEGDRKPQPFLQSSSNEGAAKISPDGRWLAYQSDESGRGEVYVRPYPGPGGKSQISTEGGTEPMWSRNGRELFYRSGDRMMAATIETKPVFAAAKPKLLFEGHYLAGTYVLMPNYDVSADGQRFLMVKASEQETAPTQLNLMLNWSDELRQRVPAGKK